MQSGVGYDTVILDCKMQLSKKSANYQGICYVQHNRHYVVEMCFAYITYITHIIAIKRAFVNIHPSFLCIFISLHKIRHNLQTNIKLFCGIGLFLLRTCSLFVFLYIAQHSKSRPFKNIFYHMGDEYS